jgi:hypothetical protein
MGEYSSPARVRPDTQLNSGGQNPTYCYTYAASSCHDWQVEVIVNGTAEICNWFFVDVNTTQLFPEAITKCHEDCSNGGNATNTLRPTTRPTYIGVPCPGAAASVQGDALTVAWVSVAVLAYLLEVTVSS